MKYVVKEPETVEAIQWKGDNIEEVRDFIKERNFHHIKGWNGSNLIAVTNKTIYGINNVTFAPSEYIVKDEEGNYYPRNKQYFENKYKLKD